MAAEPALTIVGSGAMACLFAARLAPHTAVTMLGSWKEGLAALAQEGVRLQEADGREERHAVVATSDPADCRGTELALVLVKSWQTGRAAEQLLECLAPQGLALTLQNGLGNLEHLQERLGAERVTLGVTTQGATLLGPGWVRSSGGSGTQIGAHPRSARLVGLLRRSGMQVEQAANLEGLLWGKLAINAGINPLTALLRLANGELLERPHACRLMVAAAEETAAVAAARGVRLPYEEAAEAVKEVARRTASNRSSMLQDILRGAQTEIEAISGAVAHEGRRLGVPAPVNETLWHLVMALVSGFPGDQA